MWVLEYIMKCILIRYCAAVRYPLVLLTRGQQDFLIALECQQSGFTQHWLVAWSWKIVKYFQEAAVHSHRCNFLEVC